MGYANFMNRVTTMQQMLWIYFLPQFCKIYWKLHASISPYHL